MNPNHIHYIIFILTYVLLTLWAYGLVLYFMLLIWIGYIRLTQRQELLTTNHSNDDKKERRF